MSFNIKYFLFLRAPVRRFHDLLNVDRVGSGDAYLAGALYGMITCDDMQKVIEYGNAMSAVKNTVMGDMSCSSLGEIDSIIASHKATGHQDEMNR